MVRGGVDFLYEDAQWDGDIITNPPYKYAQEFIEHSFEVMENSTVHPQKIAMFLKLTFLEDNAQKKLFKKYPSKTIYVYSKRQKCALNGDFESTGSSAVAYAWYVWEKGFTGDPVIKWI